jgi:hypothetical protein
MQDRVHSWQNTNVVNPNTNIIYKFTTIQETAQKAEDHWIHLQTAKRVGMWEALAFNIMGTHLVLCKSAPGGLAQFIVW